MEWFDPAELPLKATKRESCPKTEMRLIFLVLKLVRSYRLCFGDICDFYETFENISRFIAQIQSSFFPKFVEMPADTVIVFTVSLTGNQAAFQLFAQNIH